MNLFHRTQRFLSVALLAGAALLTGCASVHTLDTTVAAHGTWPADTSPSTYAFDRLPSRERDSQRAQAMESAAAQALAAAGFRPAADGTKPSVMVQIGVRTARFQQVAAYGDFWMVGPRAGGYAVSAPYGTYDRWGPAPLLPIEPADVFVLKEAALLIRDANTGKTLYETRVSSGGRTSRGDRFVAAMFDASMKDFPSTDDTPHDVRVPLPTLPSAMPPAPAAPVAPVAPAGSGA